MGLFLALEGAEAVRILNKGRGFRSCVCVDNAWGYFNCVSIIQTT